MVQVLSVCWYGQQAKRSGDETREYTILGDIIQEQIQHITQTSYEVLLFT